MKKKKIIEHTWVCKYVWNLFATARRPEGFEVGFCVPPVSVAYITDNPFATSHGGCSDPSKPLPFV